MNDTENTIATVTGDVYRAAFECMADKNEVRYYLKGMCLSYKHAELVATNGHILYYGPVDLFERDDQEDLIFEAPKLRFNVVEVRIKKTDIPGRVCIETVTGKGVVDLKMAEVIDGRYPDYRALSFDKGKKYPFNAFGFNAEYLSKLPKMFGKDAALQFEMVSCKTAAYITAAPTSEGKNLPGTLILMPVSMS